MPTRLSIFVAVLVSIKKSVLVWILLAPWAALGVYDLYLSQFMDDDEAKTYPKARKLLVEFVNWLPWWGWVMGLLVIIIIGVLEYVYKTHAKTMVISPAVKVATGLPAGSVAPEAATSGSNSPVNQIGIISGSTVTLTNNLGGAYASDKVELFPDMPIRELWAHISPEVGGDYHRKHITMEVTGAFALRRVQVWGRRFEDGGSFAAAEKIDSEYWSCAKLAMWFLSAEKMRNAQHAAHLHQAPL